MSGRILSIALNTFRETIRNKILYVILAFALLVIGLCYFLANLSVGELTRIIIDVGLASIQVFGVITAVFLGITLVSHEVDRKTVFLILSRPVPRWEFIVGKALGLCGTLALVMLIMTASLFLVHAGYEGSTEIGILVASAGIFMEIVLLTCFASLFSTFTTPVLSSLFTLSVFFIGHVSKDLLAFAGHSASPAVRGMASLVYYLLPDLTHFNWKNDVIYGEVRSFSVLLLPAGYLILYGAAVMLFACLIFSRKDFK